MFKFQEDLMILRSNFIVIFYNLLYHYNSFHDPTIFTWNYDESKL